MKKGLPAGRQGFTILEVIVSMAIFTIIVIVVLSLFSTALKGYRRVIANQNVQENARFLMEFMAKELRMSTVNSSTATTLVITRSDGAVVTYTFTSNRLDRTSPSSSGPISSEEVLVTGRFYVEGIGAGDGRQPKLTITMKVEGAGGKVEEQAVTNIQTTLCQRNLDL